MCLPCGPAKTKSPGLPGLGDTCFEFQLYDNTPGYSTHTAYVPIPGGFY